jgi:predicted RND superfamily exporter protein
MVDRSSYSTQFAAFVAPSREAAAELAAQLSEEETVGEVHWAGELPAVAPAALAPLAARFVSPEGRHAVYAHPRGNAWDPAVRDPFLDRMKTLDPEVTGMPVLGRFMIDRSLSALRRAVPLAALVVFLWVLADLRDLRLALLALAPAALSLGALSALMALLGIDFNPLDVLALPVVIGIAVDDGVHLVHRFRAEGGSVEATLRGTGRSVVLTSATSLAAFGTLAAASHRGLASFAQVLALGVGAALAISVLALPWALARWGR